MGRGAADLQIQLGNAGRGAQTAIAGELIVAGIATTQAKTSSRHRLAGSSGLVAEEAGARDRDNITAHHPAQGAAGDRGGAAGVVDFVGGDDRGSR